MLNYYIIKKINEVFQDETLPQAIDKSKIKKPDAKNNSKVVKNVNPQQFQQYMQQCMGQLMQQYQPQMAQHCQQIVMQQMQGGGGAGGGAGGGGGYRPGGGGGGNNIQ